MPACEECHRAKKSCDRDVQPGGSCSRCTRLGVECIPRTSRQGQGPKKRKLVTMSDPKYSVPTEDGSVLQAILTSSSTRTTTLPPKLHYGIRYLVHSWSSFAFTRRSFTLLERACHLAAKCEIPMDDIFTASRRDILEPILYNSSKLESAPLQWGDLPTALRNLCRLDCLENRYIVVREAKNGDSRYLASDKFEQDIVSVWLMEQTWIANEKPVIQLFLQGQPDFDKFTKAIHYQMSRYTSPRKTPECVRVNGLNVLFNNESQSRTGTDGLLVREMDLAYSFEILNLEHSFYVAEFIASEPRAEENPSGQPTNIREVSAGDSSSKSAETSSDTSLPIGESLPDPFELFDGLLPLDEDVDDQDYEAFLAILND